MKSKKSFRELKRRKFLFSAVVVILFPYIVGFQSDSTSAYTELSAGAGGGEYVSHDCTGPHKRSFGDGGIYVGKKFETPYRLGLGLGGWTAENKGTHFFVFPDLALDWEYFSFGTTGLRLGARNDFYFESKLLDQPPFLSGKGLIRSGIGYKIKALDSEFWLGVNVAPYTSLGGAVQYEFPFEKDKYIFINGRYGKDESSKFDEYGFSIGVRFFRF